MSCSSADTSAFVLTVPPCSGTTVTVNVVELLPAIVPRGTVIDEPLTVPGGLDVIDVNGPPNVKTASASVAASAPKFRTVKVYSAGEPEAAPQAGEPVASSARSTPAGGMIRPGAQAAPASTSEVVQT